MANSQQLSDTSEKNFLIAVDGGANNLFLYRIIPDIIIGDMDSIKPEVLEYYKPLSIIKTYPVHKDQTDTELALNWCIEKKIKEIIFINSLHGDIAHSLGVLMLLFKARENHIKAKIFNFSELIMLIPQKWTYHGHRGKKISLIPLTEVVSKVKTTGLEYSLHEEDLFRNSTRGLSNVFIDEEIKISYESGELLGVIEYSLGEIV